MLVAGVMSVVNIQKEPEHHIFEEITDMITY